MTERRLWNKKLFREGEVVFREDDMGNSAFLVEYGAVQVSKTVDGEKVSLATLRKGEMFGEMALIDDSPRMASAQALENTSVVVIPRAVFETKLDATDRFVGGLMNLLVANLRNVHQSYMRRARSVDDYLDAIDFFVNSLRQYLQSGDAEAVGSEAAQHHLERIDETVDQLKILLAATPDRRQSVLSASDITNQGDPDPLTPDVAHLVEEK
ncbi:MAG: cyclic nucleotide-binding domain-containing protein [Alphaproteobacteria bacterium]|jgi:CRP-like cAMP-binding protein|nr:cyclic nucleotide-binding domain-containing protein [Alphaproteobacteria bacterium]